MRERGRRRRPHGPQKLLDGPEREAGEILDRPFERRECGSPRLVGDGHGDVGPRRQRLEERPLRARQILEAVGEDRRARPRLQVVLQSFDRAPPQAVAISEPEPRELRAIRVKEPAEVSVEPIHVHQAGLELADGREQRVGEARGLRRRPELGELEPRDRPAGGKHPLGLGGLAHVACDLPEDVVEGAHGAGKQRGPATDELPFDAVDVDPIRNDEPGIRGLSASGVCARRFPSCAGIAERADVALEEQRDLAGMRRPDDERQAHSSIVVLASGAPSYATRGFVQRAPKPSRGVARARATPRGRSYAAADFGLRPRRATAWPGIPAAQPSHRSACFEPRLASV